MTTEIEQTEIDNEKARICNAIDEFADEMKHRMYEKVDKGYFGWNDKDAVSSKGLLAEIHADIVLMGGTPALKEVDIANRIMMLWHRRQPR